MRGTLERTGTISSRSRIDSVRYSVVWYGRKVALSLPLLGCLPHEIHVSHHEIFYGISCQYRT